jgi:hypothetical protein
VLSAPKETGSGLAKQRLLVSNKSVMKMRRIIREQ